MKMKMEKVLRTVEKEISAFPNRSVVLVNSRGTIIYERGEVILPERLDWVVTETHVGNDVLVLNTIIK